MTRLSRASFAAMLVAAGAIVGAQQPPSGQTTQDGKDSQAFRFRTGVELINVTATVTDASGRFVPGLTKDDFRVYDDDALQPITHFSSRARPGQPRHRPRHERQHGRREDPRRARGARSLPLPAARSRGRSVPVSVRQRTGAGRGLDAPTSSGSATRSGASSRAAAPRCTTRSPKRCAGAAGPQPQEGGRDHLRRQRHEQPHATCYAVKQLIRETEVLVYAIGIDRPVGTDAGQQPVSGQRAAAAALADPVSVSDARRPAPSPPPPPQPPTAGRRGSRSAVAIAVRRSRERRGAARHHRRQRRHAPRSSATPRDLDPATAGIADELSRQYYLGYAAPGEKDGRWHTIRVEVRQTAYHVRARRGYVAAGERR